MSCNIITVGHIKCLQHLVRDDFVTIGLLALGDEAVPYKDREFILKTLAVGIAGSNLDIDVVPQNSLDPSENIVKYKCKSIASGDGWEEVELEAIKKLGSDYL